MAIVEWTDISKISGSFGGKTVQNNIAGSGIHKRFSPRNDQNDAQMQVRHIFEHVTKMWRQLSDAERLTWDNAPPYFPSTNKIGISYIPSPFQCYCAANMNLGLSACSYVDEFTILGGSEPIYEFNVTALAGGSNQITVTFLDATTGPTIKHSIQMSGPYSPGVSKPLNNWTRCCRIGVSQSSPRTLTLFNIALKGGIKSGCKYFFKVTPIQVVNGVTMPILMTSFIAT